MVVDDQDLERTGLAEVLKTMGHEVIIAESGAKALHLFESKHPDIRLVITDMQMPGMSGIELTAQLKNRDPLVDVMVITAQAGIETAVEAIKAGASNYLLKPIQPKDVETRVTRILERRNALDSQGSLVAHSSVMKNLLSQLDRAAATDSNVLLTGETGTGKEVLAKYVHEKSKRAKGPFVAINCSAIPENLLESEFFGHEKGAFTGADQKTTGFFEQANNGTLFLDELGEMDLKLQPKILRTLEDRTIRRVSGTVDIKVDVRVVAATHQDLKKRVDEKVFREDLYFRLNVIHIDIPPLRERKDDIPALVEHLVRKFTERMGIKSKGIDDGFISAIQNYAFPGNVRELSNIVERALIYSEGSPLIAAMLPPEVIRSTQPTQKAGESTEEMASEFQAPVGPLNESLAIYEKKLIADKIREHSGDLNRILADLKISRSSFYAKVSKYNLNLSD